MYKDHPGPLLTTTSVRIPHWLERIVDFHSFHIEHHVMPGINFDYYPQVSHLMQNMYPDRYNSKPFLSAIIESYNKEMFIDDPLT